MGIELLFQEENDLKEKLLINENAIKFINNYIDRFSFIYDKTSSLLKDTINLEKKQTMINNSIKHIENTIANIYGDNVIYESKFGTMLVDEIKSKADKYIEKLKQIPCGCEELTQDILNDFANISFHSEPPLIEYTPPEVETDYALPLEVETDYALPPGVETDYALLPEETHIEPIPVEDIDPISYDESSFVDEMQKGFIEHVEKHHPKTLKKIIEFEKVEDKELERLIKSYMKMNKDIPVQIEKYGQARESQEERLNDIYEEKYGDKYKRKKDNTIFENPHYKKWIKKNMLEMSGGNYPPSNKRPAEPTRSATPEPAEPTRPPTPEPAEPARQRQRVEPMYDELSLNLSIMPIHLGMNYLLETIDLFEIDDFSSSLESVQEGGVRTPIIDNNVFEKHYETFRLFSDMKHDFGDLFKSVWKEIKHKNKLFFEYGIYSEVQFMAKVISINPTKFYENLFVGDASRQSQINRNNSQKTAPEFNKEYLTGINYIVCDMPLGKKYHFDPVDCSGRKQQEIPHQLTRLYTLGNHLDPSPVKGTVSEKLYPVNNNTFKIEEDHHDLYPLNLIIEKFFKSLFKFILNKIIQLDDITDKHNEYDVLIPKIKQIFLINECSYVYNFSDYNYKYETLKQDDFPVGLLKGTDFEISQIKKGTLLEKLPRSIKTNLKKLLQDDSLIKLYLMTYKELGDHIQLHEVKKIRENKSQNSKIDEAVFGTRDQILISDAFYQNERLLFWADSVKGKFDPGIQINTLPDNTNQTIMLEQADYFSYLFYFSKDHAKKIVHKNSNVLDDCVRGKKERYIRYLSDQTCTIQDDRKDILIPLILSTNNDHMQFFMSLITALYKIPKGNLSEISSIFKEALGPPTLQENTQRILKAMYLTDVSFEALRQYEALKKDYAVLLNKPIASTENNTITDFIANASLLTLRHLQKLAHSIYPTYEGLNKRMSVFANTLSNFLSNNTTENIKFTEYINLYKLLDSNFDLKRPNDFTPTYLIEQVDKKIREVQQQIYNSSDDADLEKMISDLEGEKNLPKQMSSF